MQVVKPRLLPHLLPLPFPPTPQVRASQDWLGGPLLLQWELSLLLFQPRNAGGPHTFAAAAARFLR